MKSEQFNVFNQPPRPARVRLSDVLGYEVVKKIIEEEKAALAAIPKLPIVNIENIE